MTKQITLLKIMRLILSILIFVVLGVYYFYEKYLVLPKQELIITIIISIFVFLIGLQNKLEKKSATQAYFLMLFSVVMLIMSIIGIVYVT